MGQKRRKRKTLKILRTSLKLLTLFFTTLLQAKTVYIVHIGGIDSSKYFYDYTFFRDEVSKPMVMLREAIEKAGYKVAFTHDGSQLTDVAAVISINNVSRALVANLSRIPMEKNFLLILEPPVVLPELHQLQRHAAFGCVFDLFDEKLDDLRYFKLHFPMPRMDMIDSVPDFAQKKFCVLMNGNKDFQHPHALYPEGRNAIDYFTAVPEGFDLYGEGWEGYPANRGIVRSKWETLRNCDCSIV